MFGASIAGAMNLTVTKSTNSNDGVCDADCSLREAVALANDGDSVVFNANLVGQTFLLGGTEISITKHITIDGFLNDPNVVFLSGNNTSRHFYVLPTGELNLKNMILVQGNGGGVNLPGSGGSIATENGGRLLLDRVSIRGNSASSGGAIELFGVAQHVIKNSSITGNRGNFGMAILIGTNSDLYMSNTTISGNKVLAAGDWGAVTSFSENVHLRNCTITNNESVRGGGLFVGGDPAGTFDLGNTIVAGNTATSGGQDIFYTSAILKSVGGNLIEDPDTIPGGVFTQFNDVEGFDPLFAPINSQQGGHPIDTHPLNAGSLAINTGRNSVAVEPFSGAPLTTDARGIGFPRTTGGTVDKGAFEDQSGSSLIVVTKLSDSNDHFCNIDCSLREAVEAAFNDSGTDTITMAANVFGTMTTGGSEISIDEQNVNITGYPGLSSETLVISGSNTSRVFWVHNSNVTMTGFTIANGSGQGQSEIFGGGGLVAFGGNLTLDRVNVRNNSSDNFGGGLAAHGANVVRIMSSTVANNTSRLAFGADIAGSGVTYITNTTITGNTDSDGGDGQGALAVSGSLYMRNSTVAFNRSSSSLSGAGLKCGDFNTSCNLGNNIFADNLAADQADLSVAPGVPVVSVGGNLIESTSGYDNSVFVQSHDQLGTDPGLMPLADNGGSVKTHMLAPLSVAINTGVNSAATDPFSAAPLATDARGGGFARINGGIVDKGAFEAMAPTAALVTVAGRVTVNGRGLRNAQVTLVDQQGLTKMALTGSLGYFQFGDVEVGQTYVVSVMSKRYEFASQAINLSNELSDLNFFAVE